MRKGRGQKFWRHEGQVAGDCRVDEWVRRGRTEKGWAKNLLGVETVGVGGMNGEGETELGKEGGSGGQDWSRAGDRGSKGVWP